MGCSLINHPFWGTPIYGNPHLGVPNCQTVGWKEATLQVVKEEETQKILDAYVTATFPGFFRQFSRGCATGNSMPLGEVEDALWILMDYGTCGLAFV